MIINVDTTDAANDIVEALEFDYGTGKGFAYIAKRKPDSKRLDGYRFFKYPEQTAELVATVKEWNSTGHLVMRPTALLLTDDNRRIDNTCGSDVLSFEVDRTLTEASWKLLRSLNARIVASGTPGHIHVRVRTPKLLSPQENAALAEGLARSIGVDGRKESGGRWCPNDLLGCPGTVNVKPVAEGATVRVARYGGTATAAAVERIRPVERVPVISVDTVPIDYAALPSGIRGRLESDTAIGDGTQRARRHYEFVGDLHKVVRKGQITKEQAKYTSLEWYVPAKNREEENPSWSHADDFDRCWGLHEAQRKAPASCAEAISTTGRDAAAMEPSTTNPTSLPPGFWTSRKCLTHIRNAAYARVESPHAGLLAVLAMVAASVVPELRVFSGIKDPVPLVYYTGPVGTSGIGKSSAVKFARYIFGTDTVTEIRGLGSGEGIAEAYMGYKSDDSGKGKIRMQVRQNLLLHSDEAGAMLAKMSHRGASLAAVLRSAWSGDLRGEANASSETNRKIDSYSLGFIVGFQRNTLAAILTENDQEIGLPQRFMFAPVIDPDLPDGDDVPDDPGPLDLPEFPIGGNLTITLCDALTRRVRAYETAKLRGEIEVPQLESQRTTMIAKTAALLALLDGARMVIEESDWELAETLFNASLAVQRDALDWNSEIELRKAENRAERARGEKVATAVAVDGRKATMSRLQTRILGYLEKSDGEMRWLGNDGMKRRFRHEERAMARAALESLANDEKVEIHGRGKGETIRCL